MALYGVFDSFCPSLQLSPYENKVGGYPDFYPGEGNMLTSAPSCECCHAPLVLLVQLYCPLEASAHHRLLHIFCCTESTCWGKSSSWLVLRSQSLDHPPDERKERREESGVSPCYSTTTGDWCEGAEDWGSDADDANNADDAIRGKLDDVTTNFSHLSVNPETSSSSASSEGGSRQDCRKASTMLEYQGPCYNSGYISAVDASNTQSHTTKVTQLLVQYRSENPDCPVTKGCVSGRSKGGGVKEKAHREVRSGGNEKYEKSQARHGNRAFLKFQKELANCPQQIIRYQWKGTPVPMTAGKLLEPAASPCEMCGAPRVFECQLMPPLVYILQTYLQRQATAKQLSSPDAVEFGTVLVYSCSSSCWDKRYNSGTFNFRKEVLTVQCESDCDNCQ